MNRRNLLKSCGQAAIGLMAVPLALKATSLSLSPGTVWTQAAKSEHVAVIHRMIKEQGSWWMQVRDRENGRNPAVVYFDNASPVFEISRNSRKRWQVHYRSATELELNEIAKFKEQYEKINARCPDDPVGVNVGDRSFGKSSDYYIRAFIKNGRKPEWNWSVEKKTL